MGSVKKEKKTPQTGEMEEDDDHINNGKIIDYNQDNYPGVNKVLHLRGGTEDDIGINTDQLLLSPLGMQNQQNRPIFETEDHEKEIQNKLNQQQLRQQYKN